MDFLKYLVPRKKEVFLEFHDLKLLEQLKATCSFAESIYVRKGLGMLYALTAYF